MFSSLDLVRRNINRAVSDNLVSIFVRCVCFILPNIELHSSMT